MSTKPDQQDPLRILAEAQLGLDAPVVTVPLRPAEELLHELQVHQIELEMQNETLRQTQLALEESRYLDLYEFAPVGYLTLTAHALILEINLTGAAMLGEDRSKLIQRRFARFIAAEDSEHWQQNFLRVTQHGDHQISEVTLLRGDGSRLPVRLDSLRLQKVGEDPVVRIVFSDISERKQAEEALASLEAARAAALADAEHLAQVKNDFLANMSHEIRTPLNGVLNLARIGQRDSGVGSDASATFARIHDAGRHLLAIVNDILDFSKIEAGKLTIERVAISLDAVIDHAVEFAAEKARAKGLTFTLHKAAGLPAGCLGDPLRLTQVLVNLLDNAVKFSEQGSVTLTARRDGGRLVFEIVDTGIGMSKEQVSHLFSAFEQADSSTTRHFGGTGLGLAISKRLVDLMGGEIHVNSVAWTGTRFVVQLPLDEIAPPAPLPPPAAVASAADLHLAGISILAAEDDALNRLVLKDLLSNEGAQVTCVVNGLLAVEQVERDGADSWDIVLMDIQMPVMDGHTAARRLRELSPDLPIIGLTAHAMEEERDKCLASGMAEHVAKPIEPDILVAAILRHARRRKNAGRSTEKPE
ncbi:MAG: ATP-binding protein [Sulfuricellaceae bacterium]|nr:ATP-binding protein [Sulfuricellaceae bacterium]